MLLRTVSAVLRRFNYQVETASSAAEALIKLGSDAFHLVITDLDMPVMAGDELARKIKCRSPMLPVILLTAFPPKAQPPGVDLVLSKPFSVVELSNAVAAVIG